MTFFSRSALCRHVRGTPLRSIEFAKSAWRVFSYYFRQMQQCFVFLRSEHCFDLWRKGVCLLKRCSSGFFSFRLDAVQCSSVRFPPLGAPPTRWRRSVERHRVSPSQIWRLSAHFREQCSVFFSHDRSIPTHARSRTLHGINICHIRFGTSK